MKATLLLCGALVVAACTVGGSLEDASAGSENTYGFSLDRMNQKSVGFLVCTSASPVELLEVEPIEIVGDVAFLGALFLADGESPIGSANGFPPEGFDRYLEPVDGATVSLACGAHPPSEFAQIVVGADWSGDSGGQINGFRVDYLDRRSRRTLEIPNFHIQLCGLDGEYCVDTG